MTSTPVPPPPSPSPLSSPLQMLISLEDAGLDILTVIIHFLPLRSQEKMSRVCHSWNFIFNQEIHPSRSQVISTFKKGYVISMCSIVQRNQVKVEICEFLPFRMFCKFGCPVEDLEGLVEKCERIDHTSDTSPFPFRPNVKNNEALVLASKGGHLHVVKFLVERFPDISLLEGHPVVFAANANREKVLRYLVFEAPKISTGDKYRWDVSQWEIWQGACWMGMLDVVEECLRVVGDWRARAAERRRKKTTRGRRRFRRNQDSDSKMWERAVRLEIGKIKLSRSRVDFNSHHLNAGFKMACRKGRTEVVRRLLLEDGLEPADRANLAIRLASRSHAREVVQLLLLDPRIPNKEFFNPYGEYKMGPTHPQ